MSSEVYDKIFDWLPQNKMLEPFYEGIVEFVDKNIDLSYIKESTKIKEIIDPCVGYVKIFSWEIAILDTPLFQRLRTVTQLGLAYIVYPTLTYSRFEHTIGVLGRLNQVLVGLKEKHGGNTNDIGIVAILQQYETEIRLAGLFHDLGHCLFSHLSESVINELPESKCKNNNNEECTYPSVKDIKDIFNREFASQNTDLSIFEIFSITILGTHRVAEVLFRGQIKTSFLVDPERANVSTYMDLGPYVHQAARFIAGLPVEDDARTVFLAQLMSSGLDIDKLDYMTREVHFSGIKIEMDLMRIFNKIKLFGLTDKTLPKALKKYTKYINVDIGSKDFVVLGIEKGGQFAYEEFCMARLSLYEKIYLHKKVRAAETFLKQKLKRLINAKSKLCFAHHWLYLYESIIEKGLQVDLKENFDLFPEKEDLRVTDILERRIPFRAYGFGPANSKTDTPVNDLNGEMPEDSALEKLQSVKLWRRLESIDDEKNEVDILKNKIIDETMVMYNTLCVSPKGKLILYDLIGRGFNIEKNKLEYSFVIDIPDYKRVELKPQTLHFEEAGYQTTHWTIPIDRISRYYQLHRILAYIYIDYKYCPLILLAAEKVLYNYSEPHKLVFDQSQVVSNSVFEKSREIKDCLQELTDNAFYADYKDLLPLNDKIQNIHAREKINNTIEKLNRLECLDEKLTYLDIENFLKQFESKLQLPALNLISCIKVLSPKKELQIVIEELKNIHRGELFGLLPLGSYMNSSGSILKSLKPIFRENKIEELDFSSSSQYDDIDHILFIDDNINTGRQALNIIAKNLNSDIEALKKDDLYSEEIHKKSGEGERPDKDVCDALRKKHFTFIFITGTEHVDKKLTDLLIKYCNLSENQIIVKIIHFLKYEEKLFSGKGVPSQDNSSIFSSVKEDFEQNCHEEDRKLLRIFLNRVGEGVVRNRNIIKTYSEVPNKHSMGYCNRESIVIFPGSIPTMTITALWCGGEYEENGKNKNWKPLIPRGSKQK